MKPPGTMELTFYFVENHKRNSRIVFFIYFLIVCVLLGFIALLGIFNVPHTNMHEIALDTDEILRFRS